MNRILIIEDDATIRLELSLVLRNSGYEVVAPDCSEPIMECIEKTAPHLILLDIGLPIEDGYQICTKIRSAYSTPIIFVTSRDTEMDELTGMTLGGDDFIKKPYNISILLARIAALIKRAYPTQQQAALTYRGVTFYPDLGEMETANGTVELTKTEMKIMSHLLHYRGQIVTREKLIDFLWDNQAYIDDNTLSVNITRIRNKLEQAGVVGLIVTKHRQGYMV